jgi:glycosyltransferase involved in cell wall biosynthesis
MKPVVTIGICVRNCETFIEESVESIMDQDFPHKLMEAIFVDDGSEDETLSVIKKLTSKIDIPTKILHTSWKGLGHARNMVADNTEGEFILWVDGDMVIEKNFVSKLTEYMKQHNEVGIAKGKQTLDSGGNLLATLELYARAAGRMGDYKSKSARSKALGTGGAICRTDALRKAGGFDEKLRGYGEDFDLEIRVKALGYTLATVNTKFSDYERRGLTFNSLWSRYWLRGYHTHYFFHKNKGVLQHYRMFPPAAFLFGLIQAHKLYKITRKKMVFLLPFQYLFKMTAWYAGFIRSKWNSFK